MGPGMTVGELIVLIGADGRPLRRDLQAARRDVERFAGVAATSISRVGTAAERAGANMERGARRGTRELDRIDRRARTLNATLMRLGTAAGISQLGRDMQGVGRTLMAHVTKPLTLIGGIAVKVMTDFDTAMRRVQAVSEATGQQFQALRNQALTLGQTTIFTAGQAADAMGFLAQAGFEVNDILGAMPSVLQLAAVEQLNLGRAADIAADILVGYGLSVSELAHVNDVLVKASIDTNTTVAELGEAFKFAAGIASMAGLSFEETTAALALMSNAGIDASMAGTALRGGMTRLMNPSGKVADILKRLGVQATNADGTLRPLNEIVEMLGESGATAGDLMAIFGQRAGPGMAALLNYGQGALVGLTKELERADGVASRIAEHQMAGAAGAFSILRASVESLAIAIGDSGFLTDVANLARRLAQWAQAASQAEPETLKLYTTIGLLAAAAGPAVWILGSIVRAAGDLARAGIATAETVGVMVRRFRQWHDALFLARARGESLASMLALKVHPAVVAIGAAVAVAIPFYLKWRDEKERLRAASEGFRRALESETGAVRDMTASTVVADLKSRGLLERFRRFGLTMDDVVLAVMGSDDAYQRLTTTLMGLAGEQDRSAANMKLAAERAELVLEPIRALREEWQREAEITRAAQIAQLEAVGALDHLAMAALGVEDAVANQMDSALSGAIVRHREAERAAKGQKDALSNLPPDVQALAGSLGLLADEMEDATEEAEEFTEQQKTLADALKDFLNPLSIYTDALHEKNERERAAHEESLARKDEAIQAVRDEYAEKIRAARDSGGKEVSTIVQNLERRRDATIQSLEEEKQAYGAFTESTKLSVAEHTQALKEQTEETLTWKSDITWAARTLGADVALQLTQMGEEGKSLVRDLRTGSLEEAIAWREAMRENTQAMSDEQVRILDLAMRLSQGTVELGGRGVVETLAAELGVGVEEVAGIGSQYAAELGKSIEPLLEAIGDDRTRHAVRAFINGQKIRSLNAGGPVPGGVGAPNRDSVPAILTPGEFVEPQGAVGFYGAAVFEAFRQRKIPREAARALANFNSGGLVALGRWLQSQGARVSEHPAFGGVTGVHVPGSHHYNNDAIDVNYGPPGSSPQERAFFDRIVPQLRRGLFGAFDEILWRVPGHYDHLHVGGSGGGGGLFGIMLPPVPDFPHAGIMGSAPSIYGDLRSRMQRWVDSQFMLPSVGALSGAAPELKALAQEMLAERGWARHWPSFDALVQGESGWNPNAKNPNSSAWGLGQFIRATAAAYGLPYGVASPAQQLDAMMRYIGDVYGNPTNAYRKWLSRSPHWYNTGGPVAPVNVGSFDHGGMLQPGFTLAFNGTGRPERVDPNGGTPTIGTLNLTINANTDDPVEHGRMAAMALRMALR